MPKLSLDEEFVLFNYELGIATSQWAQVENSLLQVFHTCLRSDWNTSVTTFYAVENFRSKLAMVDRLILQRFHTSSVLGKWETIKMKLEASSVERNKLAHYQANIYFDNPEGRRHALVARWRRPAASKAPPKKTKMPVGSLCLRDINAIRLRFFSLSTRLESFALEASGTPWDIPESSMQPQNPLTLRELRDHLRARLA